MAVGNVEGIVDYYDLRKQQPLFNVEHHYDLPIGKLAFHSNSFLVSSDAKAAKFTNIKDGKGVFSIEPKHNINDFTLYGNSGLIFVAN